MGNNNQEVFDETFEAAIQPLKSFMDDVLNLSKMYPIIYFDLNRKHVSIEHKVQKHLNNPQNFQTLQHYIKVLKRFTDKKIEEAIPDGSIDESYGYVSPNEEAEIRGVIKEEIDSVIVYITEILNRHKILSVKTAYFTFLTDEDSIEKYSRKFGSFESALIKGQLIERTIYFREIFQGKAPNEKINWIGSASSFSYFIKKLFDKEPFINLKQKWVIASNTFTISGNPVPPTIRTYKDEDVKQATKLIINDAISQLID